MTRRLVKFAGMVLLAAAAAGGWFFWQQSRADRLPDGIARANGRIEANQVEIASELSGRLIELTPKEGETVEAGAIVARLDATDIEHRLHQAEAETQLARQTLAAAEAATAASESELRLATQQFARTQALAERGYAANETMDQRQQQLDSAAAAVAASKARAAEARAAIDAAEARVAQMQTLLAESAITSPIRGRVQYRLVEPGAVVASGGRLLSLLDLSDVSMTIFLPAADAGRLVIGDEARIVLDVAPQYVFPANVAFVSPEAQFTPKSVETADERAKLMFRVTLQAPTDLLLRLENRVLSGVRGLAYVRTDPAAPWPERLAVKLPPS